MVELRCTQNLFAPPPRWALYSTHKFGCLGVLGDFGTVPRLRDVFLNQVVFLYRTREDAENNARFGGSAFVIGRKISNRDLYIPYLVSNRHVVFDGKCTHVRLNRRDGSSCVISTDLNEWFFHPDGYDIAVTCLSRVLDKAVHLFSFVTEEDFVTKKHILDYDIGIGDDVFMIGRFINHQGDNNIRQAVRFGSVSMMLENIYADQHSPPMESFAVEMRSRTGFSGSPVHIYRTPYNILESQHNKQFHFLLGVNFGYVNDEKGENTWLNGVVPAWRITETLNVPFLQKRQMDHESSILATPAGAGWGFTQAL